MAKDDSSPPKWTEIELLPEWEEPFYNVYTAKKHGKWLMLKALKPQYADDPVYRAMLEKEFEVRYNLAHPNIVMINDFEDVPGIGYCIITDDVYGDSLRKLIDDGKIDETIIEKITGPLVDALAYIQANHLVHHDVRPERIIFTENIHNLKLIDVGFDQLDHLSHTDTSRDINNFGEILSEVLACLPGRRPDLQRVAQRCKDPRRRYHDVQDLKMALADSSVKRFYISIIIFMAAMIVLLTFLNFYPR